MEVPFTPETLANRWGVSATMIRNMCIARKIEHFRLGKLYRIPVKAVEEFECQTSVSDASEDVSASIGGTKMENVSGINLRHAPERKRKQKA